MDERTIRQVSATVALVVFGLLQTFGDSLPQAIAWLSFAGEETTKGSSTALHQVLAAAFGGLKLGLLILSFEYCAFWWAARRYLGTWVYESSSSNFAILHIRLSGWWVGGTSLAYSVSIYREASEAIRAVHHDVGVQPKTTAQALFTQLTEKDVAVVYQVQQRGVDSDWKWDALRGFLRLEAPHGQPILKGYWESTRENNDPDVPDREMRTGTYTAFRPKHFIQRRASESRT